MQQRPRCRIEISARLFREVYHRNKDVLLLSDAHDLQADDQLELRAVSDYDKTDMGFGYLVQIMEIAFLPEDDHGIKNAVVLIKPDNRPLIPWVSIGGYCVQA